MVQAERVAAVLGAWGLAEEVDDMGLGVLCDEIANAVLAV